MTSHILLLAGTAEARMLAKRLQDFPNLKVTASLAGVTSDPAPIAAPTRRGGFGGAQGLVEYMRANAITAVIDATHPFAAQMATNAALACTASTIPRLRVIRPQWRPTGDWHSFPDLTTAAAALPSGAHVLITSGSKETSSFEMRADLTCLVRVIKPITGLPPRITQIIARPPFTLDAESALMRDHDISHLVSKNAGGVGRAKLDAAAVLAIPVFMVNRPVPPPGPMVTSIDGAVAWVSETVGTGT